MKKLGLLLVTSMFLSGCSATQGIFSERDIISASKQDIELLENKQQNISYIDQDVEDFLDQTNKANEKYKDSEFDYGYLNMGYQLQNQEEDTSEFLHQVYIESNPDQDAEIQFEELVDILDKTIGKGIKLYLDNNANKDNQEVKSTKIGRTWVSSSSNGVNLIIKLKDIKDKQYNELVNEIQDENLIIDSINIGKQQDLITLSNLDYKNYGQYGEYRSTNAALSYQLFMENKEIQKIRMVIRKDASQSINDSLEPLTRISNKLKFDLGDINKLEEIKTLIKANKTNKKSWSSDKYNFSYRNLEGEKDFYDEPITINISEVIIETR